MKNLISENSPLPLRYFLYSLLVVGGVGLLLALCAFFTAIYSSRDLSVCFSSGCFANFFVTQKETVLILSGTFSVLVSISTIGAIIVALMTYVGTMKTSALTNHISHLKTFQDYVTGEIEKLPSVSKTSVNALVWYNIIYESSRSGEMKISESYDVKMSNIGKEILISNKYYTDIHEPTFNYTVHQTSLKEVLSKIGITVCRDTRASFFESEEQIFSLIDNVNKEFCGEPSFALPKRLYK